MKIFLKLILLSGVCLGAFLFWNKAPEQIKIAKPLKNFKIHLDYTSQRSSRMPPLQLVEHLKTAFNVYPDMRLVNALLNLAKIYHFKKYKDQDYKLVPDGEQWNVVQGERIIFRIPTNLNPSNYYEIAFDYLKQLEEDGSALTRKLPITGEEKNLKASIDSFSYVEIVPALDTLGKMYSSKPSFETLRLIGKGLTTLALYTDAYFVNDDDLEVKSLAIFTVLKYLHKEGLEEDEALIAYMLGYQSYLKDITETLKEKGSFEYLLTRDMKGMKKYVNEKKRSLRDVFLFVQEVFKSAGQDSILEYESSRLIQDYGEIIIPILAKASLKRFTFNLGLRLSQLNVSYLVSHLEKSKERNSIEHWRTMIRRWGANGLRKISSYLPSGVLTAVLPLSKSINDEASLAHLSDQLEVDIGSRGKKFEGRIVDDDDIQLFYHSIAYDSFAKIVYQPLNVYNDSARTLETIKDFQAVSSPLGKLLCAYLQSAHDARYDVVRGYYEVENFSNFPDLAPYRLISLFDDTTRQLGEDNSHLPVIWILMNRRVDSRPEHYNFLLRLKQNITLSPDKMLNLTKLSLVNDPLASRIQHLRLKFWTEGFISRDDIQKETGINLIDMHTLLIEGKHLSSEENAEFFKKRISENPQDLDAVLGLSDLLATENHLEEARELLYRQRPYFATSRDLSESRIMIRATRLSLKLGEIEVAESEAALPFKTYSGAGLAAMAHVLEAKNEYRDANDIYKKMFERYKTSEFDYWIGNLLRLRKPSEALELFKSHSRAISNPELISKIGSQIAEISNDESSHETIRKFIQEFSREPKFFQLVPLILLELVKGQKKLFAFELLKSALPQKSEFDYNVLKTRYSDDWQYFTKAEKILQYYSNVMRMYHSANSVEEGTEFIRDLGGEEGLVYLSIASRQLGRSERLKLFKLISHRTDSISTFAALTLLARYLLDFEDDIPTQNLLSEYFLKTQRDDESFYYLMGRYLLTGNKGLISPLVNRAVKENLQSSLFYFMGVFYDSSHHLATAMDWYQAGFFAGTYSYEYYWIKELFREVKSSKKSIKGILLSRKLEFESKLDRDPEQFSRRLAKLELAMAQQ